MNYKLYLAALFLLLVQAVVGFENLTKGRLVISKTDNKQLTIIDLDSANGDVVGSLEDLETRGVIYSTTDGFYVVVVHRSLGRVRFLDSGIQYTADGKSIQKSAPAYTSYEAKGVNPAHVNSEYDWVFVHFDGDRATNKESEVFAFRENELRKPSPKIIDFPNKGAHHGIAVGLNGCHFLLSLPDPDFTNFVHNSSLPKSFVIYNSELKEVASFTNSCPGYHGSAVEGNITMFGCTDGLLVIERDSQSGVFKSRKISYHETSSTRVGTIVSHPNINYFFGNWRTGIVRIDHLKTQTSLSDIINMPDNLPYCEFTLERMEGKKLIVLSTSGSLYFFDINTLSLIGQTNITTNFTCSQVGRPTMTLGIDYVYVSFSNTTNHYINEVSVDDYKISRQMTIGSRVHRMAIAGVFVPHNEEDSALECDPVSYNSAFSLQVSPLVSLVVLFLVYLMF